MAALPVTLKFDEDKRARGEKTPQKTYAPGRTVRSVSTAQGGERKRYVRTERAEGAAAASARRPPNSVSPTSLNGILSAFRTTLAACE